MIGRKVSLFLKSPLFQFKYEKDGKMVTLPKEIVNIKGSVMSENTAGMYLTVHSIGTLDSAYTDGIPFLEIFLPFEKVDFFILE